MGNLAMPKSFLIKQSVSSKFEITDKLRKTKAPLGKYTII